MLVTSRTKFFLISALMVYFTDVSNAFLMDDDDVCLVEPPCTCSPSTIDCTYSHLTAIPKFLASTTSPPPTLSTLTINLGNNDIVEVGSGAFANLTLTNASDIRINLNTNKINTIHDDAFIGIGHAVTYLHLFNNNLSHIPEAFASLTNLKTLNLNINPLLSMSSPSIYTIGRTVTTLHINMNLFTEWPEELKYFQELSALNTYGYPFHYLPLDSMQGLETKLTTLRLTDSALHRIPPAVCQLEKLQRLYYTGNTDTEVPIFQACDDPMTTVMYLYLHLNQLDNFPNILTFFPSITTLHLAHNHIGTIDSSLIPADYPLRTLVLYDNDFSSIPSAILHFQQLQTLHLYINSIKSIEENDLEGLSELRSLYMSDNPIEYVANTAFQSQPYLTDLQLRRTNLRLIPLAVTVLSHISNLYLDGSPIDCSCELSYLKTWYTNQTTIHGTCANTNEEIETYLEVHLPQCD